MVLGDYMLRLLGLYITGVKLAALTATETPYIPPRPPSYGCLTYNNAIT